MGFSGSIRLGDILWRRFDWHLYRPQPAAPNHSPGAGCKKLTFKTREEKERTNPNRNTMIGNAKEPGCFTLIPGQADLKQQLSDNEMVLPAIQVDAEALFEFGPHRNSWHGPLLSLFNIHLASG